MNAISKYKICFCGLLVFFLSKGIDLTVIAILDSDSGLGKIPIVLMNGLSDTLSINSRHINKPIMSTMPTSVQKILTDNNTEPGNVSLLMTIPWAPGFNVMNHIPNSKIKIAVTMWEATKIPAEWVQIFNNFFDAICVPDDFWINIYKDCGVHIPIFVLPSAIELKNSSKIKNNSRSENHFIFGNCAGLYERKNQITLITAFDEEFKNNSNVELILHSREGYGYPPYVEKVKKMIQLICNERISLIQKTFNDLEYVEFMASLDCYILLSKGEGFSVTPREAMALGVPCILSNNTAHKTLCNSLFVSSVESSIKAPADYAYMFGDNQYGDQFDCSVSNARKEMRKVYENYAYYKKLAHKGKDWVLQYDFNNMKKKYISLIKPKKVILGTENMIGDEYIITNSKSLFKKYKKLIS